jgi:hypothetical protein
VEHFQLAKARLQPRILEVSNRIEAVAHDLHFRPVVEELMEMERRNSTLLEENRLAAERQKLDLDKTSRNLRQIHRSYVQPSRANWQSYS